MRDNGKVTQKEYVLDEDITIVSRTDTRGNILEANDAFIEASGFEWTELVGQPHNMLRHPDVPEDVFKDFWQTLKEGKPWSQIVKNRRKNGDHYWVVANATPIFENGHVTGYMSVRTPATEEQKRLAEQAYRDIDAGKLKLDGGYPTRFKDKFNISANLDLSKTITVLLALFFAIEVVTVMYPSILEIVTHEIFDGLEILFLALILFFTVFNEKQLKMLNSHITNISEGDFTDTINSKGHSLVSGILGRLKSLQIKLGADFEDVKASLNNAKRIESALNATSANIMVADKFRSIIFMNHSVVDMLNEVEGELKKDLPDFDSSDLLRKNMDVFHKNPEHQAKLLDNLKDTYKARINVGSAILDLVVDPIFDNNGERLGSVVEWIDMTAQLQVEENIAEVVENASRGSLSTQINHESLTGFEKKLAVSINDLLGSFAGTSQELNDILSNMSDGDMTQRLEGDYTGELLAMKTAVNNALNNIEITFSEVKSGSESIGNMSSEVSVASEDLSQRTQQQAASLEQTAASMEELTSTVQQSSANTEKANVLASGAVEDASKGIVVMKDTLEAMQGITEFSNKIGEITGVIDSIAFQTNLLALNAAVEAARAGEHGRGFAVVAGEVRNLAQKSAEAAKDISSLISSTSEKIIEGTALVEETNVVFEHMVNQIKEVETLVSGIALTSQEQNIGLEQINLAMVNLDQMTQQNAALVEELSATSDNMHGEVDQQTAFISHFKLSEGALRLPNKGSSRIDFADAKMKHNAWITKLEKLLAGQKTDINPDQARKADACPLGKWLYGDGQKYAHLKSMTDLVTLHAEFHASVGRVMDACHLGDKAQGCKEKDHLAEISKQVLALIDIVARDVGGDSDQAPVLIAKKSVESNSQKWQSF